MGGGGERESNPQYVFKAHCDFLAHFKLETSSLTIVPMATENVNENFAPSKSGSEALPRWDNKL